MKKSIVGIAGGVLALSLVIAPEVHAKESTPADAPYQEAIEDVTQVLPEAPEVEIVQDDTAPTLPSVYTSPLTPADPTIEPDVAASDANMAVSMPEMPKAGLRKPATASTIIHMRLPVNLTATFTSRSLQRLHIWTAARP